MVSFLKKKATALEIGIALSQVPNSDLSSLLENLKTDIDPQRVHDELIYLLAFVVDYATSLNFGNNSPETNAILDVYYSKLKEMAKKGVFNAGFYENLYYKRFPVYTNAVNTPHQYGSPHTVGVAFAKLCDAYLDIKMTLLGSSMFVEHCESISKFLKSYQIIV